MKTDNEKTFRFLNDIRSEYPCPGKDGLKVKKLQEITNELEKIENLAKNYSVQVISE